MSPGMGTLGVGSPDDAPVLVLGATGFVGRHLVAALRAEDRPVRCASRDPDAARGTAPGCEWVRCDVDRPETLGPAFAGCAAVVFLVHQMAGPGYESREVHAAEHVARAAAAAGVGRIVYLGGVAPRGPGSRHLASRLRTGRVLRMGPVPTIELRASMIIGSGSASWRIVRDVAARLPVMVLPRWLDSRSQPVAVADVVVGLRGALDLPLDGSAVFDLPGPEVLSVRAMLQRTAALLGRRPVLVPVPFLTPRLSSLWLAAVARGDRYLAGQLVEGLRGGDLLAPDDTFWQRIGHAHLQPFDEAAADTLRAERESLGRSARAVEAVAAALTPRARRRS